MPEMSGFSRFQKYLQGGEFSDLTVEVQDGDAVKSHRLHRIFLNSISTFFSRESGPVVKVEVRHVYFELFVKYVYEESVNQGVLSRSVYDELKERSDLRTMYLETLCLESFAWSTFLLMFLNENSLNTKSTLVLLSRYLYPVDPHSANEKWIALEDIADMMVALKLASTPLIFSILFACIDDSYKLPFMMHYAKLHPEEKLTGLDLRVTTKTRMWRNLSYLNHEHPHLVSQYCGCANLQFLFLEFFRTKLIDGRISNVTCRLLSFEELDEKLADVGTPVEDEPMEVPDVDAGSDDE